MNLWVSMEDDGARSSNETACNRSLAPLECYFAGLKVTLPYYKSYSPIRFKNQVRVLLDEKVLGY
jgi:nitronate monooxygenase